MKFALAATILLLSSTACTTLPPQTASVLSARLPSEKLAQPVASPAAEDQRLLTFLDAAFEEQLARSPQGLTGLGRKEQYNRLNTYRLVPQEGLALRNASSRRCVSISPAS